MSKNIKVVLGLSCEDMASFLKENSGIYPEIPLKIQDYNTPDETYQILSSEFDCSRYTAFLDMINRFRKTHLSFFFQKDETGKIEEDVVAELPNIGCDYAFYDLIEESGRAFS